MCLQIKHPASVLQLSRVKQQGMRRRHVGSEMLHDLQVKKPKAAKPAAAAAPAEGAAPAAEKPKVPILCPTLPGPVCSVLSVRFVYCHAERVTVQLRSSHAGGMSMLYAAKALPTLIAMETKNKPQGSSHAWCADSKA